MTDVGINDALTSSQRVVDASVVVIMRIASRAAGWVACALVLALLSPLFIAAPQADALQAGNPTLTKIGNRVWDDLDGDGILDASERGVPALLVELLDSSGAVVATRTTTVNGYWNMLVDPTQAWQVRVNAPAGRSFTTRGAGNNDQVDSDANAAGIITIAAGTLPPGGEDKSYDTGLSNDVAGGPPATIGNRVWEDLNGNGRYNGGEPGAANAVVQILDSQGNIAQTVTANANGWWTAEVPANQAWQIQIEAPSGFVFTAQDAVSNDLLDSDADGNGLIDIPLGTLTPDGVDKSFDAGLVATEPFVVAVIPDTQIYVQTDAGTETFAAQYDWIAQQRDARSIVFVSHEGDVVQNPELAVEWDRAESVFATLDANDIPYGIAPGNHDIEPDGSAPEYDARFGASRYAGEPWFGGSHTAEGNRSSYQLIDAHGQELLFIHIRHLRPEYGPVAAVLTWVDNVLEAHPDRLAFVTTHEFTSPTGAVLMPQLQATISDNCNVAAVFSGHRTGGPSRGTFPDACGRTVHHLLTNYQALPGGGQGFLRTVEVNPTTLTAQFEVYSPTLDQYGTDPDESFIAQLAPVIPE